jgi:hypothetical protein
MTKPNGRAGHHISYAQINPFPFKFYGPPHVLPKSQKKALGEDLDCVGGGPRRWWRRTWRSGRLGGMDLDGGRVVEVHVVTPGF